MKKILKYKGSRNWLITSLSVIIFFVVVTILAETVFFELITALVGNRPTKNFGAGVYYESEYESKADAFTKANKINEEINEEGIILLKNDDNTLPLSSGAKISVFGKNSVNLAYGGSGSGAFTVTADTPTLYSSLDAAGFKTNTELKKFYEDNRQSGSGRSTSPTLDNSRSTIPGFGTGETPIASYTAALQNSYSDYNDAALVVFTRIGGESFDLPRTMINTDGAYSEDDHYLELDKNEQDLLVHVCERFDKVIVIINSSTSMELGFLDAIDDNDATLVPGMANIDSKIKGCVWIGGPGYSGIMALGRVLKGEVNPSGRTIDTYERDFTKDPTYENFADYLVNNGNMYLDDNSGTTRNKVTEHYLDYEEGVYVGYRYYETRGYTDGEDWYKENVVFPFGYGLSYTTFEWTLGDTSFANTENLTWTSDNDKEFFVKVNVKNTGSVAGKDVVELYITAPYIAGGIEKPHVVLTGFAKTSLLNPGQSEEVEIKFTGYDFASYDYSDKNNNGFKGYELDPGNYDVRVMKNSHTEVLKISFTLESNVQYAKDKVTGYDVVNRFDNVSFEENYGMESLLSRSDWNGTYPVNEVLAGDNTRRTVPSEFLNTIKSYASNNPIVNDTTVEMPNQAEVASPAATLKLYDLIMFDENETVIRDEAGTIMVNYDDPRWNEYLDILTVGEMMDFTMNGAFKTSALTSIGALQTFSTDGPVGFVYFMAVMQNPVYETCSYASECVIAATWNTDLAYKMGESVGNEGVIGDEKGNGRPYTGWYAPAINIHRTPFSVRNFEYYSEDPFISGKLAASVVKGARSRGVYCQVKHFCVNDQETNRSGVCTWLTEQALREIYLKPFEIAVKEGGAMGIMSSFNRVGSLWTGGDYRLCTEILRNEWGFRGLIITDFNTESFMDTKQMAYAGGDLNLATLPQPWEVTTPQDYVVLRQGTKNILYTLARSNAMNGLGEGGYYIVYYAWWETTLMMLVLGLILGSAVWGFFAIRKALKQE